MSGRANERVNKIVDDGCEIASSCFACPLPACKYDGLDAAAVKQAITLARYGEIVACCNRGLSEAEIAVKFGVSTRTVQRALSKRRDVA